MLLLWAACVALLAASASASSLECDLCKGVFTLVDDVVDGNKTLDAGLLLRCMAALVQQITSSLFSSLLSSMSL